MMSVPSHEYWKLRAVQDYAKAVNATEDFLNSELAQMYAKTAKNMQKDIEHLYAKYGNEKGLTLQEAKRQMSAIDLRQVDFDSLIELAKSDKSVKTALEAAKLKSKITRLELIEMQLQARVVGLYEDASEQVHKFLYKTYEDGYYSALLTIEGIDYNKNFTLLNVRAVDNAILQDWSGKNFSVRIWGHRQKLGDELRSAITTGLIRGAGVEKTAQAMSKRMDVKLSDARRLVRTESNYAFNKGSIDGYIESGIVDEYQYLATLDNRTSRYCIELDGKIFPLAEAAPGTNCPPMHPNCRSTTVAYFGGNLSAKRRIARNESSKNYYVPADMTYKDWRKSLTDEQNRIMDLDLKISRNESSDKMRYAKYKETLGKDAPKTFADFRDIKYNDEEAYDDLKAFFRYKKSNPTSNRKYYEINKAVQNEVVTGAIKPRIGVAVKPISETIGSVAGHALDRMTERGITLNDAQYYIDNALLMFKQNSGARRVYYSERGVTAISTDGGEVITVFSSANFDAAARKIIEVSK